MIVNDRADVALVSEADGVHLGQKDLAPEQVRALCGDRLVIGWSTHAAAEIERAAALPVDYCGLGPVFDTATKGLAGTGPRPPPRRAPASVEADVRDRRHHARERRVGDGRRRGAHRGVERDLRRRRTRAPPPARCARSSHERRRASPVPPSSSLFLGWQLVMAAIGLRTRPRRSRRGRGSARSSRRNTSASTASLDWIELYRAIEKRVPEGAIVGVLLPADDATFGAFYQVVPLALSEARDPDDPGPARRRSWRGSRSAARKLPRPSYIVDLESGFHLPRGVSRVADGRDFTLWRIDP